MVHLTVHSIVFLFRFNFSLFKFLQTFALTSSNYMIVAIAVDRHRVITKPLSPPFSPYLLLSWAWFLSLIPSIPCAAVFTLEFLHFPHSSSPLPECVSDFSYWPSLVRKVYFIGIAVLIFLIPLFLIIVLYSQIIYQLHCASRRLSISAFTSEAPQTNLFSRAKLQTTNLSIAIVIIFVLTNLPYIIIELSRQEIFTDYLCGRGFCKIAKVRGFFNILFQLFLTGNLRSVASVQLSHQSVRIPPIQL